MSNEPSLDLQAWLNTVLRADSGVTAIVGDRIHQAVGADPVFPYAYIGDDDTQPEGVTGLDAFTVDARVQAWFRPQSNDPPPRVVAKRFLGAVRDAVRVARDADPSASPTAYAALASYELQNIQERRSTTMLEQDGLTVRALIDYEARIAKAR